MSLPGRGAAEEDQELADALAGRGRARVLEVLYRRHAVRVYRFCRRHVSDPAVAEELAQEAFVQTLGRVGWLRRPAPAALRAYLYRTALSLCVSQTRRRGAERRALARLGPPSATVAAAVDGVDAERLRAALARLGDAARAVLLLWAEAELPLAEVARVLDLPESTCRDRFRSALDALAADLDRDRAARAAGAAGGGTRGAAEPAAALLRAARAYLEPTGEPER